MLGSLWGVLSYDNQLWSQLTGGGPVQFQWVVSRKVRSACWGCLGLCFLPTVHQCPIFPTHLLDDSFHFIIQWPPPLYSGHVCADPQVYSRVLWDNVNIVLQGVVSLLMLLWVEESYVHEHSGSIFSLLKKYSYGHFPHLHMRSFLLLDWMRMSYITACRQHSHIGG